jgi:hypothetical protein
MRQKSVGRKSFFKISMLANLYSLQIKRGLVNLVKTKKITVTIVATLQIEKCTVIRAGHSLLFTLFANRYSATSMHLFAIATPLLL